MQRSLTSSLALCMSMLPALATAQDAANRPTPWRQVQLTNCSKKWFDSAKLKSVVAKLVPMVAEACDRKFKKPPLVRVLDEASWLTAVKREQPTNKDPVRAAAVLLGLYIPERDEVLLSPLTGYGLMQAGEGRTKRRRHAMATLAHELVHVWQQQHFQLPSRLRSEAAPDTMRKLRFLIEGHATWIEEQIATDHLELTGYAEWNRKRHLKARRMAYARGRDYIHNVAQDGGNAAVHKALSGPLPSWPQFVRVAMRRPKPNRNDSGGK